MSNRSGPPKQRSKRKGGKVIPALCNIIGTLILLAVIASCLPLTIPRMMGYEMYHVVSGSMEPEIPVGSVVYSLPVEPVEIQPEDVIVFQRDDSVVTHRVVENHTVEGEFVTKGDANAQEDMTTVPYDCLIGRVEHHFPVAGEFMVLYTSTVGKVYVILFAICGLMFNLLAGRMRERRRMQALEKEL